MPSLNSPIITGDVSGGLHSTSVDKLKGNAVAATAPTNGQVLTWDGTQWAPATNSSGGGGGANGLTYYLNQSTDADAPVIGIPGTPKQLGRTGQATQVDVTTGTLTRDTWTLVAGFVSETTPQDPATTLIPAGLWDFNVWALGAADQNHSNSIRLKAYIYNGTTLAALGTSAVQAIGETSQQYSVSMLVEQTTILATDRIYVAIEALATANGHTVTAQFGDNTPSHVHTSLGLIGGTGLWKNTTGVLQNPASLLVDADVDAAAAIAWSKIAPTFGTTSGTAIEGNDTRVTQPLGSRVKIVGRDANTIQGCIDLITDATASSPAMVLIPPGLYTENLTLKTSVSLAAVGNNNGLNAIVKITGNHTLTGGATAADNTIQFSGIHFLGTGNTTPGFAFSATGGVLVTVNFETCTVGNGGVLTTAVGMQINADVLVKLNDVKSLMYSVVGEGGTHFDVNGGSLYGTNLSTEFGTRAFLLRGTGTLKPYVELKSCDIRANGTDVVSITSTTALMTAGWSSFSSSSTTVNAFNISGAGSVVGVFNSSFSMPAGASNYLVTGVTGAYYFSANNSFSSTAVIPYETKINALVAQYTYASGSIAFADNSTITGGYFTGSKTHDFPSLGANATSSTTVTCTGATTSMFADACLSTNTAGITLVSNVTGANTVTVRAINNTGALVDLASGTLKVRASL